MSTAEATEPDPFVSAVRPLPEPDNVIPFPPSQELRGTVPMPEPPPRELSFQELVMAFHAGQAYLAFFRPDYDKVAKLKKEQPDYQFSWHCAICGAHPQGQSMMMLHTTASCCDSCLTSISKHFPIK